MCIKMIPRVIRPKVPLVEKPVVQTDHCGPLSISYTSGTIIYCVLILVAYKKHSLWSAGVETGN